MKIGAYNSDPLRNIFPRNPTQTSYLRFLENPAIPIKTDWERAQLEFKKKMTLPDLTKTYYTGLLEKDDD